MSTTPTFTPMPDRLADLKPPTRADAERALSNGFMSGPPSRFEDTVIGKRVVAGTNGYGNPEIAREARQKWEAQREAAITDRLATLTREHAELVAARDRIEARNAEALAAQKAELQAAYLATGGTAAEFERAYPALLEAERARAMADAAAERERQRAAARAMGI